MVLTEYFEDHVPVVTYVKLPGRRRETIGNYLQFVCSQVYSVSLPINHG